LSRRPLIICAVASTLAVPMRLPSTASWAR
jgi:hypothetical protein